jgi:hypothetical protein
VRPWRGVVVAFVALALVGCGDQKARPTAAKSKAPPTTTAQFVESTSTTIAPKNPNEYLRQGLDIIQENAFYSSKLDWPAERAKAQQMAAGAATFADTYAALSEVLRDLGDRHSRFATPQQVNESSGGLLPEGPPDGRVLTPAISLLHLPVVSGPQSSAGAHRYVDAAETILRGSPRACGWILDLRGNPGGNLVPIMLAAAPLLGEGDAVIVRDNDGKAHPFGYRDKKITYEGKVITVSRARWRRSHHRRRSRSSSTRTPPARRSSWCSRSTCGPTPEASAPTPWGSPAATECSRWPTAPRSC